LKYITLLNFASTILPLHPKRVPKNCEKNWKNDIRRDGENTGKIRLDQWRIGAGVFYTLCCLASIWAIDAAVMSVIMSFWGIGKWKSGKIARDSYQALKGNFCIFLMRSGEVLYHTEQPMGFDSNQKRMVSQ